MPYALVGTRPCGRWEVDRLIPPSLLVSRPGEERPPKGFVKVASMERGKPVTLCARRITDSRSFVRTTQCAAGKRSWRKRRPFCNGADKAGSFRCREYLTRKGANFQVVPMERTLLCLLELSRRW